MEHCQTLCSKSPDNNDEWEEKVNNEIDEWCENKLSEIQEIDLSFE